MKVWLNDKVILNMDFSSEGDREYRNCCMASLFISSDLVNVYLFYCISNYQPIEEYKWISQEEKIKIEFKKEDGMGNARPHFIFTFLESNFHTGLRALCHKHYHL